MAYFKHAKAVVAKGARIGEGSRVWAFANIQAGARVGRGCNICDGSFVEKGAVIGDHVTIKHHVAVFDGIVIKDDVFIGSNVAFVNDRYPRSHRKDAWTMEKSLICKGATIGSNAVILCGVTVGEYAVVGAGSVVTRDVRPFEIVCGNPARSKGHACHCGRRLDGRLRCACGHRYALKNKRMVLVDPCTRSLSAPLPSTKISN